MKKTIGNQAGLHICTADATEQSEQNMWHDYATEITGNPVGLPRDLSPTDCNHAHTMITVIAAIWNNHGQFVPA
jgi:Na+-translocating ferredoxin:NAD+ oxidoreductase RNF subunit RnfB